jgi:hypothetical protein
MVNLFDIEADLFGLADRLRELDEKAARQVVSAIADLRRWQRAYADGWYLRHSDQMQKWNAFSNTVVEEEYARQEELIEQERARILRVLAVDPRWQGSYADLVKLTNKE